MGDENISDQREETGGTNQDCQSLDLEALQATSELKNSIMEDKGSASIFSEEILGRRQHTGLVVGEEEEESPHVRWVLLGRDEGLKSEEEDVVNTKFLGCYEIVADQQGLNPPLDSESEITKTEPTDSELRQSCSFEGVKKDEEMVDHNVKGEVVKSVFLNDRMVCSEEIVGSCSGSESLCGQEKTENGKGVVTDQQDLNIAKKEHIGSGSGSSLCCSEGVKDGKAITRADQPMATRGMQSWHLNHGIIIIRRKDGEEIVDEVTLGEAEESNQERRDIKEAIGLKKEVLNHGMKFWHVNHGKVIIRRKDGKEIVDEVTLGEADESNQERRDVKEAIGLKKEVLTHGLKFWRTGSLQSPNGNESCGDRADGDGSNSSSTNWWPQLDPGFIVSLVSIIMGDENISDQREETGGTNQDCQSLDLEALQATSELKNSIMEDKGSASIFSEEILGRDQHTGLVVGEEEEESPHVRWVLLGRNEGLKSEEEDVVNTKFLGCYEIVADQQSLNPPLDSESEIAKKEPADSELRQSCSFEGVKKDEEMVDHNVKGKVVKSVFLNDRMVCSEEIVGSCSGSESLCGQEKTENGKGVVTDQQDLNIAKKEHIGSGSGSSLCCSEGVKDGKAIMRADQPMATRGMQSWHVNHGIVIIRRKDGKEIVDEVTLGEAEKSKQERRDIKEAIGLKKEVLNHGMKFWHVNHGKRLVVDKVIIRRKDGKEIVDEVTLGEADESNQERRDVKEAIGLKKEVLTHGLKFWMTGSLQSPNGNESCADPELGPGYPEAPANEDDMDLSDNNGDEGENDAGDEGDGSGGAGDEDGDGFSGDGSSFGGGPNSLRVVDVENTIIGYVEDFTECGSSATLHERVIYVLTGRDLRPEDYDFEYFTDWEPTGSYTQVDIFAMTWNAVVASELEGVYALRNDIEIQSSQGSYHVDEDEGMDVDPQGAPDVPKVRLWRLLNNNMWEKIADLNLLEPANLNELEWRMTNTLKWYGADAEEYTFEYYDGAFGEMDVSTLTWQEIQQELRDAFAHASEV